VNKKGPEQKSARPPLGLIWAGLWFLFVAGAYLIPNDALAAFTIFPAWTWFLPASVPILVRPRKYGKRVIVTTLLVWVALLLVTTEEWRSLLRFPGAPPKRFVRIITLNCASLTSAAEEVVPYAPDIVLFTENPGRRECEKIATELFGDAGRVAVGPDGVIVARAPLDSIPTPRGTSDFTAATTIIGGEKVGLIALRLRPPVFNIELLLPSAWQSVADNRRGRREEIQTIARWVDAHPEIRLMAGDFNAQPWDPCLLAMPPGFEDAFSKAGTGWGHTAVNDYPLARIDQIWTRLWKPLRVRVVKTQNSDHRMVISEFAMPDPSTSR
jgi:hypothetical protein